MKINNKKEKLKVYVSIVLKSSTATTAATTTKKTNAKNLSLSFSCACVLHCSKNPNFQCCCSLRDNSDCEIVSEELSNYPF